MNGPTVIKGDIIRMGDGVTTGTSIRVNGSLLTSISYETIEPDMVFNGGESSLTAHLVTGDITVGVGATLTVDVLKHIGSVVNNGIINGNINGIDYGTYIDNTDYLATFTLPCFIASTFEMLGRIVFNGATDTIDAVSISYLQSVGSSRTVDFQLVDVDTATVYVTATNTTAAVGVHVFDSFTIVNPFPMVDTNVELQVKDSGSQVSDASANIYFTRTP